MVCCFYVYMDNTFPKQKSYLIKGNFYPKCNLTLYIKHVINFKHACYFASPKMLSCQN